MGRGRPRKTDQQKRLEGNPGRRPLGGEVKADGTPQRPKRMSRDAGWLWSLVVQDWMTELDTAELIVLCDTWEVLCQARREVKRYPIDKQARLAFVAYKGQFDRLAARFGLTPSDRAKIRLPDDSEGDEKADKYFGVVG